MRTGPSVLSSLLETSTMFLALTLSCFDSYALDFLHCLAPTDVHDKFHNHWSSFLYAYYKTHKINNLFSYCPRASLRDERLSLARKSEVKAELVREHFWCEPRAQVPLDMVQ